MHSTPLSTSAPIGYRYFHVVAMIFVSIILISNTLAIKIIALWHVTPPCGIITIPISYLAGDILTEIYGFRKTRSLIWWGFFCMAGMGLFYWIAAMITPAPCFAAENPSFVKFFGLAPRIAAASFVAYLSGEFLNSIFLSYLKVKMQGKHFWLRAIVSTFVGQGADSFVFCFISFWGTFSTPTVAWIAFSCYAIKVLYEFIALPFTCLIVGWLKRAEGLDTYDYGVVYNPFKLKM
ncbi:MAG: queuosine precursor transporter [Chthoniobacterales bacterium]